MTGEDCAKTGILIILGDFTGEVCGISGLFTLCTDGGGALRSGEGASPGDA